MIKLVAIQLPSLPVGLGALGNVICAAPDQRVRGWRVLIRGPLVYLVSPPGWLPGQPLVHFKPGEPRRVIELPHSECRPQFELDGDIAELDKLQRFDSPPMGGPAPSEPEEIDEAELERATAPKGAKK